MISVFDQLNLRDAGSVIEVLKSGSRANLTNTARQGSIERIELDAADRLVLTGDLHDNPLHLARVVRAAGMDTPQPSAHLTLHELIHGDTLTNGMDFSYRVLARAAALKSAFPMHAHILLANHELSQIVGAGIVKDGVRVVEVFNDAVEYTFGERAAEVHAALSAFIRSMPLAVRFVREGLPDLLCAHSLPAPEMMDRFDPAILERDLVEDDYTPRRGSAHLMIWGRGHTVEQLRALGERWSVGLFVLGHEKAEAGVLAIEPNTLVLNSDHARGVFLDVGADTARTFAGFAADVRVLSGENSANS